MLKNISYLLYKVVGIYMFFYATFSKTVFGFWGPVFKAVIFVLLIISFFNKNKVHYPRNINILSISLFYIYLLIAGIATLSPPFDKTNEGFTMYMQYMYLPFYIYIFLNFDATTGKTYYQYFRYLINVACVFVLLNLFLYFYEIPIWEEFRPWFGRISNGYPTTDVVCLSYSLLILIFDENLRLSKFRRMLSTIIVVSGIIMQVSGTGIFLMAIIILVFIYCQFKKGSDVLRKNMRNSFVFILVLLSIGFSILYKNEPQIANSALSLVTNKISYFIGDEKIQTEWEGISFDSDTMEFREDEFKESSKLLKTPLDYLTGIGFQKVSTSYKYWKPGTMYVESQYDCNLITIGYLGSLLFVLFIISPLKKWYMLRSEMNVHLFYMGVLNVAFILISSRTTIVLFSPELNLAIALFYSILLRPQSVCRCLK